MIDNEPKGSYNADVVTTKCNKRLHFLRISNNVHKDIKIISLFYKSAYESTRNFSVTGRHVMKQVENIMKDEAIPCTVSVDF